MALLEEVSAGREAAHGLARSQQGAGEGGLQGRAGVTAVVCGQVCVTGVSPELGSNRSVRAAGLAAAG